MSRKPYVAVLAGLTAGTVLAGGLVAGGVAQAGPGRWTGNAHAEGRTVAAAAKKPLRAERRTDIDAVAWEITPALFARSPTFLYRVTECL